MPDFESDPRSQKFQQISSGVYRCFDPSLVWTALEFAIDHELFDENPTIMLMFVRIAEVYPESKHLFELKRAAADGPLEKAIDLILSPPSGIANAAYLPSKVVSPGELDLCWAEFLVTGKTESVEKIIAVLDEPDHARAEFENWLSCESAPLKLSETERAELQRFGIAFGRESDGQRWNLLSPGDVDILLGVAIKSGSELGQNLFNKMAEKTHFVIATKSASLWSLQSNATQHGVIRLLCEKVANQPGGFGRKLLIQQ